MCEVRSMRSRKPGPPSPAMLALLARMIAAGQPALWDYSRGMGRGRDTTTLDGQPISGVTLNGLGIRGLVRHQAGGRRVMAYHVTDAGRAAVGA